MDMVMTSHGIMFRSEAVGFNWRGSSNDVFSVLQPILYQESPQLTFPWPNSARARLRNMRSCGTAIRHGECDVAKPSLETQQVIARACRRSQFWLTPETRI